MTAETDEVDLLPTKKSAPIPTATIVLPFPYAYDLVCWLNSRLVELDRLEAHPSRKAALEVIRDTVAQAIGR